MSVYRYRLHNIAIFIVLLMTISPFYAQAKQDNPEIKEETGARVSGVSSPGPYGLPLIEEVIVIGQHSILTIRREMFDTQDLVYDTFNELNNDNEYDMVCANEARIGSQIKYKVCRPRFITEATSDAYTEWRENGLAAINMAEMRRKSLRQKEIMADLANTNPEFLNLLKRRLELKKAYESKMKQCGWNIICLNTNTKR